MEGNYRIYESAENPSEETSGSSSQLTNEELELICRT
jgi:hypothetical protein